MDPFLIYAQEANEFEGDAVFEDRRLERGRPDAGIAGGLAGFRQRLTVGLLDVLS
jgi:hypothetical protein